jgi:predicted ATP-grasp superfamily ATP-dependent carboligase
VTIGRPTRDRPHAVVLEAEANGLAVCRSLAAQGVRVWVVDPHPLSPASHSRAIERALRCPDPLDDPEAFLRFLERTLGELPHAPVVVPTTDPYVHLLAAASSRLAGRARLVLPPGAVLDEIVDKRRQYRRVELAGIPLPATWSLDDDEALESVAAALPYPCVLKPVFSTRFVRTTGIKAVVARSPAELASLVRGHRARGHPLLAQELVPPGPGRLFEVTAYVRRDGTLQAAFTARKLEQWPEDFGTATLVESVRRDDLVALAARVLAEFRFVGLCHLEFMRDVRDDRDKFIELNPRSAVSGILPLHCGINFPWLLYLDATDQPLPPPRLDYREGRRWAFPEVRLAKLGRARVPGNGGTRGSGWSQALWSWRDPWPSCVFVARGLGRALRDALQRALREDQYAKELRRLNP